MPVHLPKKTAISMTWFGFFARGQKVFTFSRRGQRNFEGLIFNKYKKKFKRNCAQEGMNDCEGNGHTTFLTHVLRFVALGGATVGQERRTLVFS